MATQPRYVIVDIDGTLSDITHRRHHIDRRPKDWKRFFAACEADPPIEHVVELVRVLAAARYRIRLATGRPENYRPATERWLQRHGIPFDELCMRASGDRRPDNVVKREMVTDLDGPRDVLCVIEDRDHVVRMWREMGLLCLQCAEEGL